MERLTEECRTRVPRAFEGEEFERRKSEVLEQFARGHHEEIRRLEEAQLVLERTPAAGPSGCAMIPPPAR